MSYVRRVDPLGPESEEMPECGGCDVSDSLDGMANRRTVIMCFEPQDGIFSVVHTSPYWKFTTSVHHGSLKYHQADTTYLWYHL
jgi:hypothetical protein